MDTRPTSLLKKDIQKEDIQMVPVNISPRFGDLSPRLVKNKEMLSRYASQTMPGLIAQLDRLTPN